MKINQKNSALLIVDVQNDFLPGGALAVANGDEIIPVINSLQQKFDFIVATQDFHPENHGSFAANHPGKKPGEPTTLNGLEQMLWPVHCVQGSFGAEFHADLNTKKWKETVQKGKNPEVDSYSGFFDNARMEDTGLSFFLKSHEIQRIFVTGLALDYCVKFTAMDAVSLGFETYLVRDASRAVNLSAGDGEAALEEMKQAGVKVITSKEIEN
ncbi:bifunctional nicotinamidase/pyrazinamidase [Algoriphagus halophytocola]|uniref:nicotinamidase n=1 Tax=Algoriphagus halophytocola TaxID=2991499 RepID=A0ABY6MIV9_9BACT|nr:MULTISPECIES: bifunctional nicotinamidase/pyrazinamidase [unclassified Algoriphagus]UZD23098.1 bifunctional nicotinamidase/pyrazinamidase [Algoriphagus sp. TR-M5]WBL44390.1 bifunctional nicotinamidase/pyrazinamidase [Algoriphagus sp. TR-M9]